jgi:hypothetical protein
VTGGWLDPRTPQGKVTWSLSIMILMGLIAWMWQRRLNRLELQEAEVTVEQDASKQAP